MLRSFLMASVTLSIIAMATAANTQTAAPDQHPATGSGTEGGQANTAAKLGMTSQPATSGSPDQQSSLSEVVVTAQRVSESLQRVPVAVAKFDEVKLQSVSATSSGDLALLVPGVTLAQSGYGQSVFIRGVGNGGTVLRYVDGVLQVFGNSSYAFNNLSSVEVDKGPQSTLFGRNATGGVIQYTTKTPSSTPALDVSVGYANYNTLTGSLYGTTGIIPGVSTDMSIYFNDQLDGWGKDLDTGQQVFKDREFSIRNKTVWDISDKTTATLAVDYAYTYNSVGNAIMPATFTDYLYNYLRNTKLYIPGRFNIDENYFPYYTSEGGTISLRLEHDFDNFRALSITSYQLKKTFLHLDYDGTPIDFFDLTRTDFYNALTQEFQLLSERDAKVQWVIGIFYLASNQDMRPFSFGGPGGSVVFGAPPGQAFQIIASTPQDSYAAFGQATVPLFADTRLTVGARYTVDPTSISGFTRSGTVEVPGSAGSSSTTFREPTFRVSLEHQFSPSIFAYASFNRGYDAGGYNNVIPQGFAPQYISRVEPETINAYEIGLKTQWLDNRVRLNAAAFIYDYDNLQEQVYQSGGLATLNAAAARIKGIDLDFDARPIRGLTISGGLELLSSIFTNYPNAPIYGIAPNGALMSTQGNATGNTTINAPKAGGNLSARYTVPTAIGDFSSSVAATYKGGWYADASNQFEEPAHTLVNLSEMWTSDDSRTSVSVWVKNVANVYYDAGINLLTPVGVLSAPGAPRTYGITLRRKF